MNKQVDLIIIGAGPMGINTAIQAKRYGLTAILLEKGYLVNSLYHFPADMTFFSTSQRLEIGEVPFMSIAPKPSRQEALEYYRRVVEHWQLDIRYGEEVMTITGEQGAFHVETSSRRYDAAHVVIATGFYDTPNRLGVPGEDLSSVQHYFDDPHRFVGRQVAIVGAGNSACQAALALHHKGVSVHMIIRKPEVKPSVKYWIKPDIENRIKEGSITAHFEAVVKAIKPGKLTYAQGGKEYVLDCDHVIALIGYQPDYVRLERWGVGIGQDEHCTPIFDSHQQTSVPGLYIAGVVCGGMKTNRFLIENSREHASAIVEHICCSSAS